MMNQLIEFSINHWEMVALFLAVLATVLYYENQGGARGLSPSAATGLINSEEAVVIDIRPEKEFRAGHITGSLNVPAAKIKEQLTKLEKHKNNPMIVVCQSGITASGSAKELKKAGFSKVYKLKGGIAEWQSSNLPLVKGS